MAYIPPDEYRPGPMFGAREEQEQKQDNEKSNAAARLISQKHAEYAAAAQRYKWIYYTIRLIAGLSAGLLPFFVARSTATATGLSIGIVVTTVLDLVFAPKDHWTLYSKATDLIALGQIKLSGDPRKYEKLLDILMKTESAKLERLVDLDALLDKIQRDRKKPK